MIRSVTDPNASRSVRSGNLGCEPIWMVVIALCRFQGSPIKTATVTYFGALAG